MESLSLDKREGGQHLESPDDTRYTYDEGIERYTKGEGHRLTFWHHLSARAGHSLRKCAGLEGTGRSVGNVPTYGMDRS
jgi:hypothetical protein